MKKKQTFYLEIISSLQKVGKIKIVQRTPFTFACSMVSLFSHLCINIFTYNFFSELFEVKLNTSWSFTPKYLRVYFLSIL